MILDLPNEDVDFLMQMLHTQPMPFVRSAPIIERIGQQIVASQQPAVPQSAQGDASTAG